MILVNSSKNSDVKVVLLTEDDWARYRDIRLAALAQSIAAGERPLSGAVDELLKG